MAEQAVADQYGRGNVYERRLRAYIEREMPEMVKDLGDELEDYLAVTVYQMLEQSDVLTEQGMDPVRARWEAEAEMYPVPIEDLDADEDNR